jgi:hypothetical protein
VWGCPQIGTDAAEIPQRQVTHLLRRMECKMSIITHIWSAPRIGVHQQLEGRKLSVDASAEQSLTARTKSVFKAALAIAVFVVVVIGIVALKSWIWIPSLN